MKKAVMYGAGNIDWGFIGKVFSEPVMKFILLTSILQSSPS